jgi:hypothetical protein
MKCSAFRWAALSTVLAYVIGRCRPLHRLREWNWHRVGYARDAREVEAWLWMAMHPLKALKLLPWWPFHTEPRVEPVILAEDLFRKRA